MLAVVPMVLAGWFLGYRWAVFLAAASLALHFALKIQILGMGAGEAIGAEADWFAQIMALSVALGGARLRRTLAALRTRGNQLDGIVRATGDAVIAADQDRRIVYFDANAEEMFGYRAADAVGLSLSALIPAEHLEIPNEHVGGSVNSGAQRRRMAEQVEAHGSRRDGSTFPAEIGIGRYEVDGEPHFTAVVRDITEQKEMEQALREERDLLQSLIDNIPDLVYFKDVESRFIRLNKAEAEALGIKQAEEALGKTDFDFVTDETRPQAKASFADEREIVESGEPILGLERRLQWPGQAERYWYLTSKIPIFTLTELSSASQASPGTAPI